MRLRGIMAAACLLAALVLPGQAFAAFHLMDIEQVIAGVDGDTNAQAIQLRTRQAGQQFLGSAARIRAWDAAGANPVTLIAFALPNLPNPPSGLACRSILIATAEFGDTTSPPVVGAARDYLMTPIPASYLAAGSLTFENTAGSAIYVRLSWGGASYTGSTSVVQTPAGNNDNTNASPGFAGPLPSSGLDALRFTPACNTVHTDNASQYALSASPATFTNNAGSNFVVTSLPPGVPMFPGSAGVALIVGLGALSVGVAVLRRRLA